MCSFVLQFFVYGAIHGVKNGTLVDFTAWGDLQFMTSTIYNKNMATVHNGRFVCGAGTMYGLETM